MRELEQRVEDMMAAAGLNAARVKPSQVDDKIDKIQFHVFPDTTVTVCCLTLFNGFNVIGKSAAVSKANFNAEIGQVVAFEDARNKIWELEGYLLCHRINQGEITQPAG